MVSTTIAALRASTTADATVIYYVTDAGQQGEFYYDSTDKKSADNTGTVLVNAADQRFKRVVQGPLRLSWFGAKTDYNARTGAGTPADDALDLALAALANYDVTAPSGEGSNRGMPTIEFDAGNYLFTKPGHKPLFTTGLNGLHLQGQGTYQTNVYLDIPEATNGANNHFIVNDGTASTNTGVINTFVVDGFSFEGVSQTERFYLYADTAGGGTAKHLHFSHISWLNLRVGIDIQGKVNSDNMHFSECLIQDSQADAVFFQSNNPQSQNCDFVDCGFNINGTAFKYLAGGALHVRGCEPYIQGSGTFLWVEDTTGDGIGIGNGIYNLTDINAEIHGTSRLLYVNAPEANINFVNPRFATGLAQDGKEWAAGTAYAVGAVVRVGVNPKLTSASKQRAFQCIAAHTATADNRPRTGAQSATYWKSLYEIQIDAGAVQLRGGTTCYSVLMSYANDSFENGIGRGQLTLSDMRLVNPVTDLVDFVPRENVTSTASLPRVIATGCRPYTGLAQGAYGATPYDPVDVSLNAVNGFEGAIPPVNHYVFAANPGSGAGLPSQADGERTFLLPRGAHVIGVRLVSGAVSNDNDYKVTNFDGSVTFLPAPGGNKSVSQWYAIDSEEARTLRVTSKAKTRLDGFFLVEYV